jgi:PAS domain S-box-containing protein
VTRQRALLAGSGLFLVFAAIGIAIVAQGERLRVVARRQAAMHVAAGAAFTLEQQLSRSLSSAYALASIVRQHGRIDGFAELAREMIPVYGGISSLALAPDAIIGDIQPRAGNEAAMGHDLLHDPDRRFEARAAVDSRQLMLAGPFTLRQGGLGMVGRLAVFLPDPAAPGGERFWGLVSVVIRFTDLLDATQISRLVDDGYAYELTRVNPETGARERIATGIDPLTADPIAFPVKVPGGEWVLSLTPHGGWSGTPWVIVLQYGIALLGAAALSMVGFLLLRQPETLRLEVAARTADLARANARLAADMEQRCQAETALSLTQQVVDRARLAIAWVDGRDRVAYANEAFAAFCGKERGALAGAPIWDAFSPIAAEAWHSIRRELDGGASATRAVQLGEGLAARHARVAVDLVAVGDRRLAIVFVSDITEQRNAEEQLRESQKMEAIGLLAGGIAHDFNNVLTGILGHASLLAEAAPSGSDVHRIAHTITTAANRAAALTSQLLGFARRGKLLTAPVDAHGVAREVVRLLDHTIDKSIQIVERLEAPRSVVMGDGGQLQQAVLNLAVNARDAMPHGGQLSIETAVVDLDARWCERRPGASPGKHLALSVADTGHGIPAEIQARIFEPFFTTKEPGRGTGMGLAMVYGIARNHGGVVEVASEPGSGSRFTMYLPLSDAEIAPAAGESCRSAAEGAGLVLLVDDDEVPRSAAAVMLRSVGYDVVALASGEEAVRWYGREPRRVAAVLVDLAMPGMDGAECYRALRALDPRVPVVLMSGYGRDGRAQELLDEGVHAFVQKPFRAEDLAEAIGRATAAAARSRDAEGPASGGARETILLVEDEDDVRPVMEWVLNSRGYRVLAAHHGREALELASGDTAIDLLLTDIVMPEMDGPELAQRLGRPGLPVLYMSGLTAHQAIGAAAPGDGVAFLQKPFTPDLLARAVRDALDRRGAALLEGR